MDSVDWRVDYILSSSSIEEVNEPAVQLQVVVDGDTHSFEVDESKFRILYQGSSLSPFLSPCPLPSSPPVFLTNDDKRAEKRAVDDRVDERLKGE